MTFNAASEQPRVAPKTGPRAFLLGVLVVLILVAAAGGAVIWSAPRSHVPIPGPDATPEQVALAYIDAVEARDFDTANAIDGRPDSSLGRFSRPQGIENVSRVRVIGDGRTAAHVLFEADFSRGDVSMPDGRHLWGFMLERGADGLWHIVDAGVV